MRPTKLMTGEDRIVTGIIVRNTGAAELFAEHFGQHILAATDTATVINIRKCSEHPSITSLLAKFPRRFVDVQNRSEGDPLGNVLVFALPVIGELIEHLVGLRFGNVDVRIKLHHLPRLVNGQTGPIDVMSEHNEELNAIFGICVAHSGNGRRYLGVRQIEDFVMNVLGFVFEKSPDELFSYENTFSVVDAFGINADAGMGLIGFIRFGLTSGGIS